MSQDDANERSEDLREGGRPRGTSGSLEPPSALTEGEILGFLKSFAEPGSEGALYLEDHVRRFVQTLRLVPAGRPGASLLELGAAFHHLTPALIRFCGYETIVCTDLWEGESRTVRALRSLDGSFRHEVRVDNFDVEKDRYPYDDASFDTVVCCEILEHLLHDPMHMLQEINRIVKPGGHLLLTTPNVASAKSLSCLLRGESPYIWGQYPVGGGAAERHNREYTALEVKRILQLAGFAIETLTTAVSWWPVDPRIDEILRTLGFDTTMRGDNTLALGRRAGPPQSRWPAEFYHLGEIGRARQGAAGETGTGREACAADARACVAAGARACVAADARAPAAPDAQAPVASDGRAMGVGVIPSSRTLPADAPSDDAPAGDGVTVRGPAATTDAEPAADLSVLPKPLRILVVNNIVPNHDRGGSCYRMMTLLKLMVEEGHTIEYLGRDAKGMEKYVRDLEALGLRVHGTDSARLRVWDDVPTPPLDLAAIMKQGRFDVAVLVLWFWSSPSIPEQYLQEIRRLSPGTRILVLSDDVHWLHDARMAVVTGKRSDLERGLGYRGRELEIFRRSDLVAAITEDDAARIAAEDPALRVEVLPHFVIPREGQPPGFEARRDLVTVGAFGYYANVDAAVWFAREVFPRVRAALPGVRFKIVGANPPPAVKALADAEIDVTGWVPDVIEELDRCRVFVSAIRYGTGLKTKNIQAMGAGIPLVGTSISLEGSGAVNGRDAIVEDDPEAFADAVVRLYTDERLWSRQAAAGRALALSRFGKDTVRAAIRRTFARAAALEAARAKTQETKEAGDWSITSIERRDRAILSSSTASERFRARLAGHLALANEQMKAGRPAMALVELRRVLSHCGQGAFAQNPRFFSGVMCRFGDVYRALGQNADAVDCYREALVLDPEEDDAVLALRDLDADAESAEAASGSGRAYCMSAAEIARPPESIVAGAGGPGSGATSGAPGAGGGRNSSVPAGFERAARDRSPEICAAPPASVSLPTSARASIAGPASPAPEASGQDSSRSGGSATSSQRASAPASSEGQKNAPPGASRSDVPPAKRKALRPRAVPIEGRRGYAFLCSALEGDRWMGPLGAYLERFTPEDDVSLLVLGPPDRIEPELIGWIREHAVDENAIADIVIVPPPANGSEMPRFVAAADALLVEGSTDDGVTDTDSAPRGGPVVDEARRQGIPILRAGADDLRGVLES